MKRQIPLVKKAIENTSKANLRERPKTSQTLTKKLERDLLKIHDTYWNCYLKGDVKTMAMLLADDYSQVGSAETEVFFNKREAVKFLRDTIKQVAGKVDMRKRVTKLEAHGDLILIHELCDLYDKADKKWLFYSKFRASTWLKEINKSWKIIHQHSSFPNARTDDGENLAIEKIEAENQQLREAVKRRTVELECKQSKMKDQPSQSNYRFKNELMIRTFTLVFLLVFTFKIGHSQKKEADSLRTLLATATKPIDRFDLLNKIVLELTSWKGDNVDSASCMQMLQIGQQLNNDSLLSISYNWLGSYFYLNKGDNSSALEYFFKAIPLAEKTKDKRRLSSLYFDISLVYFDIQNNQAAFANTLMGGESLPEKSHPLYDFMLIQYEGNMAQYFLIENKADSAFHYVQRISETTSKLKGGQSYDFLELTMKGSVYTLLNNPKLADENFSKALVLSDVVESTSTTLLFYNNYIPFLLSNNRINEAGFQAERLLKIGSQNNNNNLKLAGAGFLRRVFDARNKIDSAYYYSQMEAKINAMIFSQNNINRVQALAFSSQIRVVEEKAKEAEYQNQLKLYGLLTGLGVFSIIAFMLYRNNRQKQKANHVLEATLSDLKSTQSQLIQSEKMASLGELTAGIAHEIQNPLNFVNNFSEVNEELLSEMKDELDKGNINNAKLIANDAIENQQKILHHGKRADAIVKGMLQHSRASSGTKELTNINTLADEYLRLAYHGLRAKDKSFNATMKTDFDESIASINIIPQDMGRVILNLITNAFYAVNQQRTTNNIAYEPTVSVSTKKEGDKVLISVKDNGNGIPESIKEKIFQPFFTTKPTGQGTGLGLSLSYDIVKAHGGELKVETKEGEGTTFMIIIPFMQ